MKPSDAIAGKTEGIKQAVESYGFVNVRIFGSVCCGEDIEGSDLDLLVTIPTERVGRISLFDILDLESALEEMLGIPVDINWTGPYKTGHRHPVNLMPSSCA